VSSLNKVTLIGRAGKDPEVRTTQDGGKIVNMTIATSDVWKDKNSGERKEKTEWHRIVIFNDRLADVVEKYVRKGSQLYIEGAVQTRKWTDKDGHEKYTTEIVLQKFKGEIILLDSKKDSAPGDDRPAYKAAPATQAPDLDDDIPF